MKSNPSSKQCTITSCLSFLMQKARLPMTITATQPVKMSFHFISHPSYVQYETKNHQQMIIGAATITAIQ